MRDRRKLSAAMVLVVTGMLTWAAASQGALPEPVQIGTLKGADTAPIAGAAADALDPTGLVTIDAAGVIVRWDSRAATVVWKSSYWPAGTTTTDPLFTVAISASRRFVGICSRYNATAKVFNYATGALVGTLTRNAAQESDCTDLEFTPDDRAVLIADGKTVHRFDVATGAKTLDYGWGPLIAATAVTPDGGKVIAIGTDIVIWNADSGDPVAQKQLQIPGFGLDYQFDVARGLIHPSAKVAALGLTKQGPPSQYAVALIDLALGGATQVLTTENQVDTLWFSADASKVAAFDLAGNWYEWDATTGAPLLHLQKSPWFGTAFYWYAATPLPNAFAADGATYTSADAGNQLRVWRLATP